MKSSAVGITAEDKKFVKAELIRSPNSPSSRHGILYKYLPFLLAEDVPG